VNRRPVKVLHVIESLGAGGAERLLYTNLRHLDPAHVNSTVATLFGHDTHWTAPVRALGVNVYELGCNGHRDLLRAVARIRGVVSEVKPDVIHSHLWTADVAARIAGALEQVPVVSTLHNCAHDPRTWSDGSGISRWKRHTARLLDRWTAAWHCARLIAVSDAVQRSAREHLAVAEDRLLTINSPVDPYDIQQTVDVRRELGLAADAVVLLHVGRVSPEKGMIHVIRALPRVLAAQPQTHLICAGPADEQWLRKLEAETRMRGLSAHVHFLGQRRDIGALLAACDVFVFPSLHEGLGMALLEAMAAGRACVASAVGVIPDIITHGDTGWLVPPADEDALATMLLQALADPAARRQVGRAAADAIGNAFAPEIATRRLAELYRSVSGQAHQQHVVRAQT
jgi:glycosyltransferase involved in cell wall biosynthesis